jgi:hypothetical protein
MKQSCPSPWCDVPPFSEQFLCCQKSDGLQKKLAPLDIPHQLERRRLSYPDFCAGLVDRVSGREPNASVEIRETSAPWWALSLAELNAPKTRPWAQRVLFKQQYIDHREGGGSLVSWNFLRLLARDPGILKDEEVPRYRPTINGAWRSRVYLWENFSREALGMSALVEGARTTSTDWEMSSWFASSTN